MMVHVKDVEPPRAKQCPTSFVTYMGSPSDTQKSVQWSEPVFEDNVKIKHVTANFLPGHSFRAGKHNVLYTATDLDGNKAKCGFTITGKSLDESFTFSLPSMFRSSLQFRHHLQQLPHPPQPPPRVPSKRASAPPGKHFPWLPTGAMGSDTIRPATESPRYDQPKKANFFSGNNEKKCYKLLRPLELLIVWSGKMARSKIYLYHS